MTTETKTRILVVDDEAATAKMVRDWYRHRPFVILEASSGEEGLLRAHTDEPDIILMDLMMPGINGFEACQRLKADPETDSVPVVLLSADHNPLTKKRGFDEAGIDDYIEKPFNFEELDARIRAMIRARKRMLELRASARVDELTRLANYRVFSQRLHEEWLRSVRYPAPLSLVMLDLDDFKKVNDTYGHLAGDRVLREFALLVEGGARATDVAARYGGEEFGLILPHTDRELAFRVAERIRRAVEAAVFVHDERPLSVTVSAGVATVTSPAELKSPEELIALADKALFAAKKAGKNRVFATEPPEA